MVLPTPARTLVLLFLCVLVAGTTLGVPAATDETRFVTAIPDLPLMPGLEERSGENMVFETAGGRIVEALASGRTDRPSVVRFYEETLPQLGWTRDASLSFHREGEMLAIDFPASPSPDELVVRFSLFPANR